MGSQPVLAREGRRNTIQKMSIEDPLYYGPGAALLTPAAGEHVLYEEIAGQVQAAQTHGHGAVLIGGTTGKGTLLKAEETVKLISAARETSSTLAIIAGVHGQVPDALLDALVDAGADAILAGVSTQTDGLDGLLTLNRHATARKLRLIAYCNPKHGHIIQPHWYTTLAREDIALKDSSGDRQLFEQALEDDVELYVGSTGLLGIARKHGACGCLSGLGGVMSSLVRDAWLTGDTGELEEFEDAHSADRIVALHQKGGISGPLKR